MGDEENNNQSPPSTVEVHRNIEAIHEHTAALSELNEAQREAVSLSQDLDERDKEHLITLERNLRVMQIQHAEERKAGRLTKKQIEDQQILEDNQRKLIAIQKEATASRQQDTKDLKKNQKELSDWQDDFIESGLESIGLSSKLGKAYRKFAASGKTVGDLMKNIGPKIKAAIPAAGPAAALLLAERIARAAIELDTFNTGLIKATGMSRAMANEITHLSIGVQDLGISMENGGKAGEALYTHMTSFKNVSQDTRATMVKTTAMLEHMGISSAETAENMQFMIAALGMSGENAAETSAEFAVLAKEIGMPIAQMSAQFKANAPILAKFGRQGPQVFKKLAVAARQAGMDVGSVLAITEKFDTFEGAADSVGMLNAILGGPFLSSMDMVTTTDPTERMKLLSSAINDAGQSFDQMDYYTRKSIAAAAGLKDTNELALVMAGNWDLVGGGINKTSSQIEEIAAQQHEFNTTMEQLSLVGKQIFIPLGQALLPLLQGLGKLLQFLAPVFPLLGKILAVAVVLWGLFSAPVWVPITAGIAALVAVFMNLGEVMEWIGGLLFHKVASPGLIEGIDTFAEGIETTVPVTGKWKGMLGKAASAIKEVGTELNPVSKAVSPKSSAKGPTSETVSPKSAAFDRRAAFMSQYLPPTGAMSAQPGAASGGSNNSPINIEVALTLDGDVITRKTIKDVTNWSNNTLSTNNPRTVV